MSFIIRGGRLREINAWGSFKSRYDDEIDVDYTKEQLESYGEVVKHKDEYRLLNKLGIAFGTSGDEMAIILGFSPIKKPARHLIISIQPSLAFAFLLDAVRTRRESWRVGLHGLSITVRRQILPLVLV